MKAHKLDKDEKEILKSFEKGEWRSTRPSGADLNRYAEYARNTLKKNQRINIRISQTDLNGIQAKAVQEGLPYQTLIASVLHRYVSGRLTLREKGSN